MHRFSGLGLKTLTVNTAVQFIVRITTSTSTLLATLLIASISGYELVGSFTKVVAFVSIFYLLIDFGINPVFLKKHLKNAEDYLGNLLLLRLFTAILFILSIILLVHLLPNYAFSGYTIQEKWGIILFSFTLIPFALQTTLQAILQKHLNYKLQLLPSFVSSILLVFLIYIATIQNNFNLLLFSYFTANTLQVLLLYFTMKKNLKLTPTFSNIKYFSKNLLLASYPLGIMLFFNLLYAKADIFLLSVMRPTAEVGVYGVSYRFFELAIALPAFLSNSTYPLLLKSMHEEKIYKSLIKRYLILFTAFSLIVSLFIFTFSPLITIFKSEFEISILPLQLLSLSLPFFFLTSILQWHFLIKEKLKFLVPLYGGALILNIVLNIIFIPKYSYYAAALSTGVCEGLVLVIMMWYFFKVNKKALEL